MDKSVISGTPGKRYNYVFFLSFDEEGVSRAEKIHFPIFDSREDFAVNTWEDPDAKYYELSDEEIKRVEKVSYAEDLKAFINNHMDYDTEHFSGGSVTGIMDFGLPTILGILQRSDVNQKKETTQKLIAMMK